MNCVAVEEKASFDPKKDGLNVYHYHLFHGKIVNRRQDANNLGDVLKRRLLLEKNAFECRFIIKPSRNLVVPSEAKSRLSKVQNVDFFRVIFRKLFLFPFRKGDLSLGPNDYRRLDTWLDSFSHKKELRQEVGDYFELILPSHECLARQYRKTRKVNFCFEDWDPRSLDLSAGMLRSNPVVWSTEGIIFRADVFQMVEGFFCWDYFHSAQFAIAE